MIWLLAVIGKKHQLGMEVTSYFKYKPLFVDDDGRLTPESLENVIKPISEGYYYLPSRSKLNDPSEGIFINNIHRELYGLLRGVTAIGEQVEIRRSMYEYMNQIDSSRDVSGVFSLSTDPVDELMWAHYGNSHHGIAIEYDFDLLTRFTDKGRIHSFDVRYSDHPPAITMDDVRNGPLNVIVGMLGNKSTHWGHEKEFRIVIDNKSGVVPHDYRAVKSITFGCRVSEDVRNEVYDHTKERVIDYCCTDMEHNSYVLQRSVIPELKGSHPRGHECTVDWSQHLVDIDADRRGEFAEIMTTAIESDPHFKELMLADSSTSEGERALLMYEATHSLDIDEPARYTRHYFPL